jgi:hypothetical protein
MPFITFTLGIAIVSSLRRNRSTRRLRPIRNGQKMKELGGNIGEHFSQENGDDV